MRRFNKKQKKYKRYYTTPNIEGAIRSGVYIGEQILKAKILNFYIHAALTGLALQTIYFAYYGLPDTKLKEMYNYA